MQLLKTLPIIAPLLLLLTSLITTSCVVVRDGEPGKDGTNGESCTLLPGEEDGSFLLKCGEEEMVIRNGQDGQNGESCSIAEDNETGSYTIVCGEDSATIRDGEPGAAASCVIEENEDGSSQIICGEDSVTVRDGETGAQGESCTATDNLDGSYTISCGEDSVTVYDGADGITGPAGPAGPPGPSCSVSETPGGDFVITCGSSSVTISRITLGDTRWQDPPFPNTMTLEAATSACADLGPGWRLPNIQELANLLTCDGPTKFTIEESPVDCAPCQCAPCQTSAVCSYVFGNPNNWNVGTTHTFWSSTRTYSVPPNWMNVNFSTGVINNSDTSAKLGVRCIFKGI